jgi:hypothetical protein
MTGPLQPQNPINQDLRGKMKHPELYDAMCIWVLTPDTYLKDDEKLNGLARVIQKFMKQDLEMRAVELTAPDQYKSIIGSGEDSIKRHWEELDALSRTTSDVSHALTKYAANSVINTWRIELDENYLGTHKGLSAKFESTKAIVNGLQQFAQNLEIRLNSAISLRTPEDGPSGLKRVEKEWQSLKKGYEANSSMNGHPGIEWADGEISRTRALRDTVAMHVRRVGVAFDLDQIFGRYWSDACNAVVALPHQESQSHADVLKVYCHNVNRYSAGWVDFALAQLDLLETIDPDNRTNWCEYVLYGNLKGCNKIRDYLTEERGLIEALAMALKRSEAELAPEYPAEYKSHLCRADFNEALSALSTWLGYSLPNADAEPLQQLLPGLKEWLSEREFEIQSRSVPLVSSGASETIYSWASRIHKIVQSLGQFKEPTKDSSKTRLDYKGDLERQYDRIGKEYAYAQGRIRALEALAIKWLHAQISLGQSEKRRWNWRRSVRGRLIMKFGGRPPQHLTQEVLDGLCDAYRIAPRNPELLEKMSNYGRKPDSCGGVDADCLPEAIP